MADKPTSEQRRMLQDLFHKDDLEYEYRNIIKAFIEYINDVIKEAFIKAAKKLTSSTIKVTQRKY